MQRLAVSVMLLITITTFCNAGHNERNDFHLDDADDDLHVSNYVLEINGGNLVMR